jgi:hypothetical protein
MCQVACRTLQAFVNYNGNEPALQYAAPCPAASKILFAQRSAICCNCSRRVCIVTTIVVATALLLAGLAAGIGGGVVRLLARGGQPSPPPLIASPPPPLASSSSSRSPPPPPTPLPLQPGSALSGLGALLGDTPANASSVAMPMLSGGKSPSAWLDLQGLELWRRGCLSST